MVIQPEFVNIFGCLIHSLLSVPRIFHEDALAKFYYFHLFAFFLLWPEVWYNRLLALHPPIFNWHLLTWNNSRCDFKFQFREQPFMQRLQDWYPRLWVYVVWSGLYPCCWNNRQICQQRDQCHYHFHNSRKQFYTSLQCRLWCPNRTQLGNNNSHRRSSIHVVRNLLHHYYLMVLIIF